MLRSVIAMTSISNSEPGRSGLRPHNEFATERITGWVAPSVLAPKERRGIEPPLLPKDVARGRLTLAFGNDPVLDADRIAGQPVRPARDVAGSEDAGPARLQIFVDDYPAIDREAGLLRERDRAMNANVEDDVIGGDPHAV
jgi:hypothetical protein